MGMVMAVGEFCFRARWLLVKAHVNTGEEPVGYLYATRCGHGQRSGRWGMEPETFKGLSQDIFYLFSSFFHQTTPSSPLIEKHLSLLGDGGKFADNIFPFILPAADTADSILEVSRRQDQA
jgi:hypothetical protein